MTKPRITIIGLGLIGGSIGLALKASNKTLQIVGHDIDPGQNRLAKSKGAVDKSSMNLLDACEDANLVIIATPITAIRETLAVIGPHLSQDCVVTDTAKLKEPVLAWADEVLPDGISFVGGVPTLNYDAQSLSLVASSGLESARADLFQNAPYALCPSVKAAPTAVKRVTDMVNLIQAQPFYIDPTEHDGMRAAVDGLPILAGLAMMQQAGGAPGWREARKLADDVFGMATVSLASDAETQRAQVMLNATYLLPRLDALIHHLGQLRQWITEKDAAALEKTLEQAASVRNRWLAQRALGEWDEELGTLDIPDASDSLGNLLGFGLGRQRPKDK